jgi:hypothetical protein
MTIFDDLDRNKNVKELPAGLLQSSSEKGAVSVTPNGIHSKR